MAGLGEAASLAGLISLAGQAIQGVSKIYAFIKAYQTIAPKAQVVAKELELLKQALSQTQITASRATIVVPELRAPIELLHAAVSSCQTRLSQISRDNEVLPLQKKTAVWKRIKVAALQDYFAAIHAQLSSEKESLLLRLSAFTW